MKSLPLIALKTKFNGKLKEFETLKREGKLLNYNSMRLETLKEERIMLEKRKSKRLGGVSVIDKLLVLNDSLPE